MTLEVYSFGEALVDLLSDRIGGNQDASRESFTKYPGGAPANVAVAVACLGGVSYLIGRIGKDSFGRYLMDEITRYGVCTDYLAYSERGRTALAFVSLDAAGERSFTFYDDNAAHHDFGEEDLSAGLFPRPVVFCFSSGTLARSRLRAANLKAIDQVRDANGIVAFDINFRSGFWAHGADAAAAIFEVAGRCDIVKASREELTQLYGENSVDRISRQLLNLRALLVVITDGANPVVYYTHTHSGQQATPPTRVVDTTAAGDAFVGGLLYRIARCCEARSGLVTLSSQPEWLASTIAFAARCGARSVAQAGAFTSLRNLADLADA